MAADPGRDDRAPQPCRYCPIEHGGYYFPELSKTVPVGDRYRLLSIVRKTLCKPAGANGISCDPQQCERGLVGADTPRSVARATRQLWLQYQERTYEPATNGNFDDILDELGL